MIASAPTFSRWYVIREGLPPRWARVNGIAVSSAASIGPESFFNSALIETACHNSSANPPAMKTVSQKDDRPFKTGLSLAPDAIPRHPIKKRPLQSMSSAPPARPKRIVAEDDRKLETDSMIRQGCPPDKMKTTATRSAYFRRRRGRPLSSAFSLTSGGSHIDPCSRAQREDTLSEMNMMSMG